MVSPSPLVRLNRWLEVPLDAEDALKAIEKAEREGTISLAELLEGLKSER